jgi:hypothetical protein
MKINILYHIFHKLNIVFLSFKSQLFFYTLCFLVYGFYIYFNYKEIAHFNDCAVYLFYMDYDKFFFTPHNRFIAAFTQYLPILASMAELSFSMFVKAYVFNGLVSTFLLYLIYGFYSKQWQNGWVFVLSLLIGYKYSFYYLIPEHFGYSLAVFIVLMYSHLINSKKEKSWYLFSVLVGVLMIGSHLYALAIILIGLFYLFLSSTSVDTKRKIFFHFITMIFVFVVLKKLIFFSGYESGRLNVLKENLIYIKTLDNAAFRYVFSRDQTNSLDFKILILVASFLAVYKRQFLVGICSIGVYFFTYYLNCLYSYIWQGTEYMELYGRLIFFCLLILVFILSLNTRFSQFFYWFLCIICFFAFLNKTSEVRHEYSKRYQTIYQLTLGKGNDKIYIQNDSLLLKDIWFTWALPHETLLVSTLEGSSKTAYVFNGKNLSYKEACSNYLVGSLRTFNKKDLSKTYFKGLDSLDYQLR